MELRRMHEIKKRYLVTGGCGFIGSHLVDSLIHNGHEVVVLDDLSTGRRDNLNQRASLILGDVSNYATVEEVFKNIDGCFHLAAISSVEKSKIGWAKTNIINAGGAVNIFQAASRNNNKIPVVYASSAAVYGDCKTMPISEDAQVSPLTAYGVDKYSCDLHGRVAWNVHGVANIGLRPFNIYGSRQNPDSPYSGVISIFINNILACKPIKVFGDGEQVRDFVYVEDAIHAFIAAMEKLQDGNFGYGHQEINLCTGRGTSINKLIEIIASISGCNVERINEDMRQGDIKFSIGNPARLQNILNVQMETDLLEGLSKMLYNFSAQEKRKMG
jgi:UDP-glucose 4-epimerase